MSAEYAGRLFDQQAPGSVRIPWHEWKINPEWVDDSLTLSLQKYADEMSRKILEIDEEILTGKVVDLLRDRGYTVIEPEARK